MLVAVAFFSLILYNTFVKNASFFWKTGRIFLKLHEKYKERRS